MVQGFNGSFQFARPTPELLKPKPPWLLPASDPQDISGRWPFQTNLANDASYAARAILTDLPIHLSIYIYHNTRNTNIQYKIHQHDFSYGVGGRGGNLFTKLYIYIYIYIVREKTESMYKWKHNAFEILSRVIAGSANMYMCLAFLYVWINVPFLRNWWRFYVFRFEKRCMPCKSRESSCSAGFERWLYKAVFKSWVSSDFVGFERLCYKIASDDMSIL